ncbi:hypothetical protein [Bradyrhizobium sp. CCGE-LA001]|uniref:hypothetical protein n=1 Tax=Bradyrhizobium sp. CCGE-LA001 TaxID=1223566 RepID=UPI0011982162|nr:hypothetical protein [Bradyrhizobium sp. CCGE-LA001]
MRWRSVNSRRLSIFLTATAKEFRCEVVRQFGMLSSRDWPRLYSVSRASNGKESVMKKKIAEIGTTIRTTTPYIGW